MQYDVLFQLNEIYRHGVYAEETLSEEEMLSIEEWVETLIEEGYDLDQFSDEELYEAYLEEMNQPIVRSGTSVNAAGEKIKWTHEHDPNTGRSTVTDKFGTRDVTVRRNKVSDMKNKSRMREQADHYDIVSEYLVSEGFCDSYEDADVIMANMSEEWRDEILEKADNTIRLVYGKGGKGVPIKDGGGNVLRTPNVGFAQQGRDFKMATAQADETASQNAGRRGKINRRNAALYNRALKKGIENATNRSDREPEEGHDYSNDPESFTNRNARRRRSSGK